MNFIFVALGGAVGAMARYAISLIPLKMNSLFDFDHQCDRCNSDWIYCWNNKWQGWSIQEHGFILEDRCMRWLYHIFYIFAGIL